MPVRLDLPPAWKRVPYMQTIDFVGPDWSASDLKLEIRNQPGDTGAPLIALGKVSSGEGVTASFTASYPLPSGEGTAPATTLAIRINETTLEGLLGATPKSAPLVLFYDLHVGSGSAKIVAMYGTFTINPGVTV